MNSNEKETVETGLRERGGRSGALSVAIMVSVFSHLFMLILVSGHHPNGPMPDRRISVELVPPTQDAPGSETPVESPGFQPHPDPGGGKKIHDELAVKQTGGSARQDSVVPVAAATPASAPIALPVLAARGLSEPVATPEKVAESAPDGKVQGDKNWEDSVRLELMNWLERHKRYPIAARRKGVQGAVMVRFVVSSDGVLLEKELLQSSGSKHLDAAAMNLLSRAAPYPKLPAQLLVDALEVRLPIEYRLVVGRHRT